MNFGSDNQTGASDQVLAKLVEANQGFTHGYGDDQWTQQAIEQLKELFECDLSAFFVTTGTVANCLSLAAMVKPWQTILSHPHSHLILDETTAPEFFTGGARMIPVTQRPDKLSAEVVSDYLSNAALHVPHNPQPAALSITQASENGQVYSVEEVSKLSQVCQEHDLRLHMDGARFANALASLACTPAEITWRAGVDALCLGATKNGGLCAEAVIFFDKSLAEDFEHRRKRAGHLVSKGRLFGAQFCGWLENNHWLDLAQHANQQANRLAEELSNIEHVQLVWPVEGNELFLILPKAKAAELEQAGAEFYDWYTVTLPEGKTLTSEQRLIRLVTSFQTTAEECDQFVEMLR